MTPTPTTSSTPAARCSSSSTTAATTGSGSRTEPRPGRRSSRQGVDGTYSENVGGTLFFNSDDDAEHGEELWKTDGTKAGTKLVKDINTTVPGANSFPENLTAVGHTLFFQATDGTHGVELWKSNGTEAGTRMVKDIDPNASDPSDPQYLTGSGGRVYFQAFDGNQY